MSNGVKLATRRLVLEIVVRTLKSLALRVRTYLIEDSGSESKGYVLHRRHRLPPKSMRHAMCGEVYRFDFLYFLSAVLEAANMSERLGYTQSSRVVDIGCGLGRLATGMLVEFGDVQYLGVDANEKFVRWCRENIEKYHPAFHFVHLDMANELYNPAGTLGASELRLPLDDASADIVYLCGVFTNMVREHVDSYIGEVGRILRSQGRCFVTAFVEDDVPDVTINPTGYVPYVCNEPLLVVRYSRQWLFSTFKQHGLQVEDFRYHKCMYPKQSEIYLVKADLRT